jgi:hypothetical protein
LKRGLFGSRSEAVAFLLGAGIEAQRELLRRIGKHSGEIERIRQSLKRDALVALRGAAARTMISSQLAEKLAIFSARVVHSPILKILE